MSDPAIASGSMRRILIVEDEVLIGVLLEDMLIDVGYTVVATVARIDQALETIAKGGIDGAVLDLNLNGVSSLPIADKLREQKIPFLFVTGYGEHGLPPAYQGIPALQKPFQQDVLEAKLRDLFAAAL